MPSGSRAAARRRRSARSHSAASSVVEADARRPALVAIAQPWSGKRAGATTSKNAGPSAGKTGHGRYDPATGIVTGTDARRQPSATARRPASVRLNVPASNTTSPSATRPSISSENA